MGDRLSSRGAKPRLRFALPTYPTLTASLCVLLTAGCGGEGPTTGAIRSPYDAAAPQDTAEAPGEHPQDAGLPSKDVAPPSDASPVVDADDSEVSYPYPGGIPMLVTSPPILDKAK